MVDKAHSTQQEVEQLITTVASATDGAMSESTLQQQIYYLRALWMDFHLYINVPYVLPEYPPKVIKAGMMSEADNDEFVYTIYDFGDHFSTSVGECMASGARSTGKMLNTIRKMMTLLAQRVHEIDALSGTEEGGDEKAIRLAFGGHEIAQRMAFKQCIIHELNILATNFDPGQWGQHQLSIMEHLAERGFLPGMKR